MDGSTQATLNELQDKAAAGVDKRVKALAVAGTLGQQQVSTVREGISLKARVQMLKEDIVREATTRMLRLHEQEELWVLEQALAAIGGETAKEAPSAQEAIACRNILGERLRLVRQRLESAEGAASGSGTAGNKRSPLRNAEAVSSSPSGDEVAAGYPVSSSVPKPVRSTAKTPEILRASYWSSLTGLEVSCSFEGVEQALRSPLWSGGRSLPLDIDDAAWAEDLSRNGWANSGHLGSEFSTVAQKLHEAALRLREAGWPPVFIFMTDAAWQFAAHIQDAIGQLLKHADDQTWCWHLEPSFAAFLLDGGHDNGSGKRLGNSFPSPHRDHSYSASFDSKGNPKLVSVWVPLTDVEVDNGCMYVVPREFDPTFGRDSAYEHMQLMAEASAAVEAELSEDNPQRLTITSLCGFPLAGARPLPCRRGCFLAWNSNLIHWGSFCHSSTHTPPRCSAAFVFRRCCRLVEEGESETDGAQTTETMGMPSQVCDPEAKPLDLRENAMLESLTTVRRRLMFVLAALRYFEHWYDASAVRESVMAALRSDAEE